MYIKISRWIHDMLFLTYELVTSWVMTLLYQNVIKNNS